LQLISFSSLNINSRKGVKKIAEKGLKHNEASNPTVIAHIPKIRSPKIL